MIAKIAITNQKGGVSKTTTALNIADVLIHLGYKVLFLDLDPQVNATETFGAQYRDHETILDVLKKECSIKEAIQNTAFGDIVAGDDLLVQEEMFFNAKKAREFLLDRALTEIEQEYDFIIMDTPPNLGIYMVNALTAADGCIIPVTPSNYSIRGLGRLASNLYEIREDLNPKLKVYGVLLSCFDARKSLSITTKATLPEACDMLGLRTFNTVIRTDEKVETAQNLSIEDAMIESRSLLENFHRSKAAADYASLVNELLEEL